MSSDQYLSWVKQTARDVVDGLKKTPKLASGALDVDRLLDTLAVVRARTFVSVFGLSATSQEPDARAAISEIVEQAAVEAREVIAQRFGAAGTQWFAARARERKLVFDGLSGPPAVIVPTDEAITAAVARLRKIGEQILTVVPPRADLGDALALLAERGVGIPRELAALYGQLDGLVADGNQLWLSLDEAFGRLDRDAPDELWIGNTIDDAALYYHRGTGELFDEDDEEAATTLLEHLEMLARTYGGI